MVAGLAIKHECGGLLIWVACNHNVRTMPIIRLLFLAVIELNVVESVQDGFESKHNLLNITYRANNLNLALIWHPKTKQLQQTNQPTQTPMNTSIYIKTRCKVSLYSDNHAHNPRKPLSTPARPEPGRSDHRVGASHTRARKRLRGQEAQHAPERISTDTTLPSAFPLFHPVVWVPAVFH